MIEGLAIDWVGRNIYWVDSGFDTIEVASLEPPHHRTVLLSQNISQPRGLALDPRPSARYIFWTDWGQHPMVLRADMNGKNLFQLVTTKLYWPNCLALDLPTRRVYFADSKLDYIDFVDYDGNNRQQVTASEKVKLQIFDEFRRKAWINEYKSFQYVLHPHAMTVFEDNIYWTDRRLQKVLMYPKYRNGTSDKQVYPSHDFAKALGIIAVHPVLQPTGIANCG